MEVGKYRLQVSRYQTTFLVTLQVFCNNWKYHATSISIRLVFLLLVSINAKCNFFFVFCPKTCLDFFSFVLPRHFCWPSVVFVFLVSPDYCRKRQGFVLKCTNMCGSEVQSRENKSWKKNLFSEFFTYKETYRFFLWSKRARKYRSKLYRLLCISIVTGIKVFCFKVAKNR